MNHPHRRRGVFTMQGLCCANWGNCLCSPTKGNRIGEFGYPNQRRHVTKNAVWNPNWYWYKSFFVLCVLSGISSKHPGYKEEPKTPCEIHTDTNTIMFLFVLYVLSGSPTSSQDIKNYSPSDWILHSSFGNSIVPVMTLAQVSHSDPTYLSIHSDPCSPWLPQRVCMAES